ncbi:MAG TPA: prephenate dehydrogenase/arogenate dehydrogenase family protein [Nitrospiraceae bacterium]|jgi:prephenate dehydrogenase|nr:prephenate dehydrogenase/arogenate dehydrogenase family protein [Nitrospiraceae bacterium]
MFFERVAILGVGLIGASFGLAIRVKGLCKTIVGHGRKEQNLRRAKELGIIDAYSMDAARACEGSDLIVLATPVGILKQLVGEIAGSIKKGAVITDVGSVKSIVYDLESLVPAGVSYVGSHPIAGSDQSGIDDARADLFRGARCIITPTENSHRAAIEEIASLWELLGSRVESLDPHKHDRIYAAVSHLPHLLAYALVNAAHGFSDDCIEYAGQGFKDVTRIALSSPELWRDISIFNKDNLINVMEILQENLDRIHDLLVAGDASGIEKEFSRAQRLRLVLSNDNQRSAANSADSMTAGSGL